MKRLIILSVILALFGCNMKAEQANLENLDSITGASGNYEYESSSYNLQTLIVKLKKNQYGNINPAVSISTVNDDNTPNVGVFIPQVVLVEDKNYLLAWISDDTHTLHNLKSNRYGIFLFHEYDNTVHAPQYGTDAEKTNAKFARNMGCRVVVQYVGDKLQDELYHKTSMPENFKSNNLFLEIIKIYPLG